MGERALARTWILETRVAIWWEEWRHLEEQLWRMKMSRMETADPGQHNNTKLHQIKLLPSSGKLSESSRFTHLWSALSYFLRFASFLFSFLNSYITTTAAVVEFRSNRLTFIECSRVCCVIVLGLKCRFPSLEVVDSFWRGSSSEVPFFSASWVAVVRRCDRGRVTASVIVG